MILVVAKYLIPKGYRGMTVYPFVFLKYYKDKVNAVFLNHEKIHLQQQIEMLVIPFYIWYVFEFFVRLVQYKNKDLAYRNISFEREAYSNETNFNYLKKRSLFGFVKYINLK